jgi:hypothetical protein
MQEFKVFAAVLLRTQSHQAYDAASLGEWCLRLQRILLPSGKQSLWAAYVLQYQELLAQ